MLLLAFVLSLFGGRLIQLQVIGDAEYAAAARKQRVQTISLPASRGDISTRGGATLATTVERKIIYADPGMVQRAAATPKEIAGELAPLLGVSQGKLKRQLGKPDDRYVVLQSGVEPARAERVMAQELDGIGTQPDRERVYPAGSLAANVTGFVGADGHGAAGLEYGRDETLAGRDGRKVVEIGLNGRHIPTAGGELRRPEPGRGLRLTLDRDIQWKAQQAVAAQVRKTGADRGSVIVMDPRTGELLAVAVAPTLDPNRPGATAKRYRDNPPLQHVFEPGSTNKVITMAAALEGQYTPATPVTVPPVLDVHGETINDSHSHGTLHYTLAGVLAKSSNIGTALIAQQVGKRKLYRMMRAFGLGRPLGISYPGASAGILPPPGEWDGIQQYTIPFGQGVAVNAVQMASVYATIANGGVRVEPSLVAGTVGAQGQFDPAAAPERRRVLRPATARALTGMMEAAASERGTGSAAQVEGYRVAGKTGTAQRVDPECGCYRGYDAMFAGFAPAGKPELVVQVVLHNPQQGHYGGQVAAPVFRDVMSFALKTREVPPTGTDPAKLRLHAK